MTQWPDPKPRGFTSFGAEVKIGEDVATKGDEGMNALRGTVLTWTLLTTTFFWTSTMRMALKPEISQWRIFGFGGQGAAGDFWLPPLLAGLALFTFYLEGRGRLRTLYHALLLAWHLALTAACLYGVLQTDARISFGTWGISLALEWLLAPFALFLALAAWLVASERRRRTIVPRYGWSEINARMLVLAAALAPVAFVLFRVGAGFDAWVKAAVALTILQWIVLVEALGRPGPRREQAGKPAPR